MIFNKVSIVGVGMVGGALNKYFQSKNEYQISLYDPAKNYTDLASLNSSELVFICVPTPFDEENKKFDKSYLLKAIEILEDSKIIVIKSTIPPGTIKSLEYKFKQHKFFFNPEFLTEATAEHDTFYPNRQIVGCLEEYSTIAEKILSVLPPAPFTRIMSSEEAEMIKYFSNCFYAIKVAYANQIYDLCQSLGVNYDAVKEAAVAEPMMGTNHWEIIHKGYRGYGGKCLPKDAQALIQLAHHYNLKLSLLEEAEKYNNTLRVVVNNKVN